MRGLKKEILFRIVKILDMGYIVFIYFILGIALAKLSDIIFGIYDEKEEKKKSTIQLGAEIMLMIWSNIIIFYVARNVVQLIPSPFHNVAGFDHFRLKELGGSAILGVTYVYFQTNLKSKISDLHNRLK
jgi:hypothetical protein